MDAIYVIGSAMTVFGRHPDRSVKDLTREAVTAAVADAGCESGQIGAAFFSNTGQGYFEGQHTIPGQIALRPLGLNGLPIVNVENACASASTAFYLAVQSLRAGASDVALAVGVEKMVVSDKRKAFGFFEGGWDVHDLARNRDCLRELEGPIEPDNAARQAGTYSEFMNIYSALARFHMRTFGTTREQIAAVSAKNHGHSVHNPLAQYRKPFTVEEILAAPPVVWPLTVPMCAPLTDGAAAAVLCNESALRRIASANPVRVLASVLVSGSERALEDHDAHATRRAALAAYDQAGLGPEEVSLAEVHDASAVGEIIQIENLGLCPVGEGGAAAESGETTLGGRIPVNPSGGLECKGHPIGATGLGQLHELVLQLRGGAGPRQVDGARVAIAENGGGFMGYEEAAACVTILGT